MTTNTPMTIPAWTLGDRLAKARQTRHLSQTEMAHLLGLSLRSVNRYEVGALEPKRQTLLAWAMATGVDPEWAHGCHDDD